MTDISIRTMISVEGGVIIMNMEVALFEGADLEDIENKLNEFSRTAKSDGFKVVDIRLIPVVRESFIYYFGQVNYVPDDEEDEEEY